MIPRLTSSRFGSPYPTRTCFFCNQSSVLVPASAVEQRQAQSAPSTSRTPALPVSTGTPRSWTCSLCLSSNRRDEGEPGCISSYELAMTDERANTPSRALPSRAHLPSTSSVYSPSSSPSRQISDQQRDAPQPLPSTPFCSTCLSHQRLSLALLASYNPPTHASPEEEERAWAAYRASIEARYPSVCVDCSASVQDAITAADARARRLTLGGWLDRKLDTPRDTKGKGRELQYDVVSRWQERTWVARGVLWGVTQAGTVAACLAVALRPEMVDLLSSRDRSLPAYLGVAMTLSLAWTCWDPTWLQVVRAKRRGLRAVVKGRSTWIKIQLFLYAARLALLVLVSFTGGFKLRVQWMVPFLPSSDIFEGTFCWSPTPINIIRSMGAVAAITTAMLLARSFSKLSVHTPIPSRLVSKRIVLPAPNGHAPPADPSVSPPLVRADSPSQATAHSKDLLWPLSLTGSSSNVQSLAFGEAPRFGHHGRIEELLDPASDAGHSSRWQDEDDEPNGELMPRRPDEMDWTPTVAAPRATQGRSDLQLGPQRYFAPEAPTGLEDLFGSALDGLGQRVGNFAEGQRTATSQVAARAKGGWAVAILLIALTGAIVAMFAAYVPQDLWQQFLQAQLSKVSPRPAAIPTATSAAISELVEALQTIVESGSATATSSAQASWEHLAEE